MLVNDTNWYSFTTLQWPNVSPPLTFHALGVQFLLSHVPDQYP